MRATIEVKNALLTLDNEIPKDLTDYLIEIQYDKDNFNINHAVKIWIHNIKTGVTILRIQEKSIGV